MNEEQILRDRISKLGMFIGGDRSTESWDYFFKLRQEVIEELELLGYEFMPKIENEEG